MEIRLADLRDRIHLRRASDTKGRKRREKCEYHAEPLHVKPALQRIHRTALHTSVFRLHPVFHSYVRLRILRRDTEHAGKPAPQDRSGTADRDRRTYADDISGSDRSRQSRRQRAELRHLSFRVRILCHRQPDPPGDREPLDESCTQRQEHMGSQQQDDHRPPPDYAVYHSHD